jgi:hypothetical protein
MAARRLELGSLLLLLLFLTTLEACGSLTLDRLLFARFDRNLSVTNSARSLVATHTTLQAFFARSRVCGRLLQVKISASFVDHRLTWMSGTRVLAGLSTVPPVFGWISSYIAANTSCVTLQVCYGCAPRKAFRWLLVSRNVITHQLEWPLSSGSGMPLVCSNLLLPMAATRLSCAPHLEALRGTTPAR